MIGLSPPDPDCIVFLVALEFMIELSPFAALVSGNSNSVGGGKTGGLRKRAKSGNFEGNQGVEDGSEPEIAGKTGMSQMQGAAHDEGR